ncbi:MAG: TetR family transcriptional regulator C-terminal domain-containing protein [Cyclobacteriaceae bacterium]|nr:TetR/AcrR family transcriptional regulator [Cyclobacteriaceae bacterium]
MAKTKKTKKEPQNAEDRILRGYIAYVLDKEKEPKSVFKLCQYLGIDEAEFYKYFSSLKGLKKEIWTGFFNKTVERLTADANFESFTVREKLLAFYFTFIEELVKYRDFITMELKGWKIPSAPPKSLNRFKAEFENWIKDLLAQGKENDEISKRPYLDRGYPALIWFHLFFVLQFWVRDDSKEFERTDMAIEKSVNLAFEVIGHGILDHTLDFGKFLYQQFRA